MSTPLAYCTARILQSYLSQHFDCVFYDALHAGLSFSASVLYAGMQLHVSGFSDRLPLLLHSIVDEVATKLTIDPTIFNILKIKVQF